VSKSSTETDANSLVGYDLAGQYTLREHISDEALGRVFRAETEEGAFVDVKLLHPHFINNEEAFARFGREMVAAASIEHPNTVRMLDFGEHKVWHYIVFEHISAVTLADVVHKGGPLNWERVALIAMQIASALADAHSHSIVHRNLSPANILLLNNAEDDYVNVRDFGMSRLLDGDDAEVTAIGARVGAVAYAAPEYFEEGIIDPRCDVFGLGALMFYMLVGRAPRIGYAHEEPVRTVAEQEVPVWLGELIAKLTVPVADHRPMAEEVVRLIEDGMGNSMQLPKTVPVTAANFRQIDATAEERFEKRRTTPSTVPGGARMATLGLLLLAGCLAMLFGALGALIIITMG
jgi:eukaryotic-like serine/threonine-protein kinase